jgi:hypothetical protein
MAADTKENTAMPTERTLAQHRKRWQTAEHLLEQERTDRTAAERAAEEARRRNPNQYAMAARWDEQVHRVGPWRPALESPLGRALLHLAARHDVAVEATVEYPAEPGPTLVSVPPHLGRAIEHLVQQDGFR